MISFNELNKEANYYRDRRKTTVDNPWNQDKFQNGMFEIVQDLNLSKEQLVGLLDSMVRDDVELDMPPKHNESKDKFELYVNNKVLEFEKGKSMVQ